MVVLRLQSPVDPVVAIADRRKRGNQGWLSMRQSSRGPQLWLDVRIERLRRNLRHEPEYEQDLPRNGDPVQVRVCSEKLIFRQISLAEVAPSACLSADAIYSSVNLDFIMATPSKQRSDSCSIPHPTRVPGFGYERITSLEARGARETVCHMGDRTPFDYKISRFLSNRGFQLAIPMSRPAPCKIVRGLS